MSLEECQKIQTKNPQLYLKIYKGHFATSHSHINYYIDVAQQKANISEAKAVAEELLTHYKSTAIIDTILCLDGTEVIGALLAEGLCRNDYTSLNAGSEISVLTPESAAGSQLFFRDNLVPMIENKRVLILAASVVTGFTAVRAAEAISYYGGTVAGIAAIFSTETECMGIPIASIFDPASIPDYISYNPVDCPLCKAGWKVEALVNSHGCSKL